ncbi:hypothetical protein GY45DRAFT_1329297 [Cubamyces sp. BRFM 1775]|nr:hypothetical protein GY45DRAFT_1329297 [Cubamyces sp. BRFM 1775]
MCTIFEDNKSVGQGTQDPAHVGLAGAQSRLPLDVCFTIFEFAPKRTLIACSRVSKAWREVSLPHLFRSITVSRCRSFDDFLQFLDEHADLAWYIRNLTLEYAPRPVQEIHGLKIKPVVDRPFLVALANKLPRLQELCLLRVAFGRPVEGANTSPAIANNSRLSSSRLRRLLLVGCHSVGINVCHIHTLLDIFAAVPVDSIQTRDVYISSSLRHNAEQIPSHLQGQLDMPNLLMDANPFRAEGQIRYLYRALRQAIAPRCLRQLRLDHIDRGSNFGLRSLGEILHHSGRDVLQTFELPFVIEGPIGPLEDHSEHWKILHLDECRNLEAFGILVRLNKFGPPPRVPFSAVCNAILAHVAPTLRRLTVTIFLAIEDAQIRNNETICLGALDDMLEARFPALEMVRLEIQIWGDRLPKCKTAAEEVMPKSMARGILEVVQWRCG